VPVTRAAREITSPPKVAQSSSQIVDLASQDCTLSGGNRGILGGNDSLTLAAEEKECFSGNNGTLQRPEAPYPHLAAPNFTLV